MYAVASSGGKDSTLALYRAQQEGLKVSHLFHIYNSDTTRVRFLGYQTDIIEEQARLLGLKSIIMPTSSEDFDNDFRIDLEVVKSAGLRGVIFGNIFLSDVRDFYETRVRALGLEYYDILWKQSTKSIIEEFVGNGFKAIVTSVWLKKMDMKYLGRWVDGDFINDLEQEDVDICGENGEYHSLVYDGPCFQEPLQYRIWGTHLEKDNIFLDIRTVR